MNLVRVPAIHAIERSASELLPKPAWETLDFSHLLSDPWMGDSKTVEVGGHLRRRFASI
jgi:hypothetical protein